MGQTSPVIEKYLAELSQLSAAEQLALVVELTVRLSRRTSPVGGAAEGDSDALPYDNIGAIVVEDGTAIDREIEGRQPNSIAHLAGSWTHGGTPDELIETIYAARVNRDWNEILTF